MKTKRNTPRLAGIESLETRVYQSTTPTANAPVIYSWSDWNIDGVTPMVNVERYCESPALAASRDIPLLRATPAGKRAIRLMGLGEPWEHQSIVATVKNKKFDVRDDLAWHTEYFQLLKDANVTPDFIAMDYEGGISAWQMSAKNRKKILTTPSLKRKLTLELQQFQPSDFQWGSPNFRDAAAAMNGWAAQLRAVSMREAIYFPARKIFGHDIPMSNFDDLNITTPVLDLNGWETEPRYAASVGGLSSPAFYLGGNGNLYQNQSNPLWANFIHDINEARSIGGDTLVPWICDSRLSGQPELWAQMMYQLRATGVKTMLLFNPEGAATSGSDPTPMSDAQYAQVKAFTRQVFETMLAMPSSYTATGGLGQLAVSTRTVTTGGVTTTRGKLSPFLNGIAELGRGVDDEQGLRISPVMGSMSDDVLRAAA